MPATVCWNWSQPKQKSAPRIDENLQSVSFARRKIFRLESALDPCGGHEVRLGFHQSDSISRLLRQPLLHQGLFSFESAFCGRGGSAKRGCPIQADGRASRGAGIEVDGGPGREPLRV